MLDFLGVTEHFSCMENTPFSFPALFRDMAGEAVSLDGVIFSGSIVSANQEMVEISIEKGESSNEVIFSFPALPEGRWSYNVLVQADDGSQRILFSGYISVLGVSRVAQLAGGPPMKNRTLLVAMPGEATMRLRMEWMATTAAQAFAYHALQASKNAHADAEMALQASKNAHADAEMASQAAKTATDAAATAATRAEEAEGYAGSALASKRAAAASEAAAGTSATNAARDAKSANDAKTAVESLAATWPETVNNGKQQIIEARNEAVTAIQDKQADSVLAVGRASQTAQQNIASAQSTAVQAVQTAQTEAVGAVTPLVQRAETAKEAIDQAERRINTAATNATTAATSAASSATAAQQALEAMPQVDASGNMTLAGNITAAGGTFDAVVNANGGINTAGLVLGNEVPLVLGQGDDAVKIHGDGNGAAVIEGTNASHMDVAIPVKFQDPTTFDEVISFVAASGEKMKCILFGKESGPTRAILYEESNGFLSITDPNNVNSKTMTVDRAGDLWVYRNENHNGVATFNTRTCMHGTIDVGGVLTFRKTPNANAGINIPLTVGAPTDTGAVNRLYAAGMAGVTGILTTNAFLNTEAITKSGTSTVTQKVPYCLAGITVPKDTHSTIRAKFEVSSPQWNYSSFSGFSFIWRATGAAKLTFGMGRGAKTVRSDLSIDSYSIIPANDLAYNHGEILDITFDNVRDTQRNGYTVRVREIYALDSTAGWQVKTTTSFIPASQNEPVPWTIAKVIYQQKNQTNIFQYDNLGTLWLMLTGGQANNLYKIATCRGVSTFETGVGISSWVTDVLNNSTGNISVYAGNGEYTYYQPGGTNPVFYGLEAMAVNAIESEETTDFVDINIPL